MQLESACPTYRQSCERRSSASLVERSARNSKPRRKAVAQFRRDIAQLKRTQIDLERRLQYLESRETERLKAGPRAKTAPAGTRFTPTALRKRREGLGLSREDFARLAGVSASTLYNWESGRTKPSGEHLAALVALRGIGKREAEQRLELLNSAG